MTNRIKNPRTGKREDLEQLSRNGYKYHYLKLLELHRKLKSRIQNAVELDGIINFDKDKWELEEAHGAYRLKKKDPDEDSVMELLAFSHPTTWTPEPVSTEELISENE